MEMIRIERVAVCCSVLQCGAVCCSVLQCDAVRRMRKETMRRNHLAHIALQCVAVRCSALQCVLVCCSHAKSLASIRGLLRACVLECVATKCANSQKMNESCYILMSHVTYA